MDKFKELVKEILSDGYGISLEIGPAVPGADEGDQRVAEGKAFAAIIWTGDDDSSRSMAEGVDEDPAVALEIARKAVYQWQRLT